MLSYRDSMLSLETFYKSCVGYWSRSGCDERTSHERALKWDIVEIYQFNGKKLHDASGPNGEELCTEAIKDFCLTKSIDIYGKREFQNHAVYNSFNL